MLAPKPAGRRPGIERRLHQWPEAHAAMQRALIDSIRPQVALL
jgi:hypothetical protein